MRVIFFVFFGLFAASLLVVFWAMRACVARPHCMRDLRQSEPAAVHHLDSFFSIRLLCFICRFILFRSGLLLRRCCCPCRYCCLCCCLFVYLFFWRYLLYGSQLFDRPTHAAHFWGDLKSLPFGVSRCCLCASSYCPCPCCCHCGSPYHSCYLS